MLLCSTELRRGFYRPNFTNQKKKKRGEKGKKVLTKNDPLHLYHSWIVGLSQRAGKGENAIADK